MKKAILGKKLGMTQIFEENGTVVPVTVVLAGPCTVVQKKTEETDGYAALQLSFGDIREKLVNKPVKGHYAKSGAQVKRYLREFRLENCDDYEVGATIDVSIFEQGDSVDVSGLTRGRGFTGPIQRWNQSRGPMAHGSKYHRGPGSLGATSSPSKTFKGKHMGGQYGHERVTIQNLAIARVDSERNLLLVKGALPGPKGTLLEIRESIKA